MSKSKPSAPKDSAQPRTTLLQALQARFEAHPARHAGWRWTLVAARLAAHPEKLSSLQQMEDTGGEPDVVGQDAATGEVLFFDCAEQSPAGRTSLCYDGEALESRKKFKPRGSAVAMAEAMGVELLDEQLYLRLQQLGEFDTKSSSWLRTPAGVRARGGAIFGDRRFGRVFIYHNGAESYYEGRGFRAALRV